MLTELDEGSVQMIVTSPPYFGLRDYGMDGQIGLEPTPDAYVTVLVDVFRSIRRVLKDDGVCWLNLGDSYASSNGVKTNHPQQSRNGRGVCGPRDLHPSASRANLTTFKDFGEAKPKDLLGIPWRVAFALQTDGWYLRSDVIWHKPNPMPESITDRPTSAHEHLFLLAKSKRYYYDAAAIAEPLSELSVNRYTKAVHETYDPSRRKTGASQHMRSPMQVLTESAAAVIARGTRNKRNVWTIPAQPFKGAHFAVFPEKLVEPCVLAGSRSGDTVLDPFCGSGRAGIVALKHGRDFIGIDLNPEYCAMALSALIELEEQCA
jgi:DNA modification methylase